MVQLQGISRLFYKRLAQWVRTVYRNPTLRKSDLACHKPGSTVVFEWPAQAAINEMIANGQLNYLTGFENNRQYDTGHLFNIITGFDKYSPDGTGRYMNLILCNGDRSTQRDKGEKYYDHMMPVGSNNKIRSVTIHYRDCIYGFSFFDKEGALLWKIGWIDSDFNVKTVLIEENERIVGVVAKLFDGYQSVYTDW